MERLERGDVRVMNSTSPLPPLVAQARNPERLCPNYDGNHKGRVQFRTVQSSATNLKASQLLAVLCRWFGGHFPISGDPTRIGALRWSNALI